MDELRESDVDRPRISKAGVTALGLMALSVFATLKILGVIS